MNGGRRPASSAKELGTCSRWTPGVADDDMPIREWSVKARNHSGAADARKGERRASRISRQAVKSRCAREWGGWGRLSVEGPRHYNSDRSEGPWGSVAVATRAVVFCPRTRIDSERCRVRAHGETRRTTANGRASHVHALPEGAVRYAGLEAVLGKTRRTEF